MDKRAPWQTSWWGGLATYKRRKSSSPDMSKHHDPPPESSRASTNYPSPSRLNLPWRPTPSHPSVEDSTFARDSIETEDTFSRTGSMTEDNWSSVEPRSTATSMSVSSSVDFTSVLAHDYSQLDALGPCLPAQYSTTYSYPELPSSSTSGLPVCQPGAPSMESLPTRSSASMHTVDSMTSHPYNYADDNAAMGVKLESSASFAPSLETMPYQSPGFMPMQYPPSNYSADIDMTTWPKEQLEATNMFPQPSSSQHSRRPSNAGSSTSWTRRLPRKHTTREEANFQCKVEGCGKFFSRSYNFKSHMDTHDDNREYPFPCPVADCNKKFVRKTDLQRHNQSVHMKERNHTCDYCGRAFSRKDTLRRHMEDGCSKRFDLRTMDIASEAYKSTGAASGAASSAASATSSTASRQARSSRASNRVVERANLPTPNFINGHRPYPTSINRRPF